MTSSVEMTKGCTDTLLRFQIFFYFQGQIFIFLFPSASVLGKLWVKGTAVSIANAVLVSPSKRTGSGLLQSTALSIIMDPSQHKIVLADSSNGWRSIYVK
jgi:hypothetical protein